MVQNKLREFYVKWKVVNCGAPDECWCAAIQPIEFLPDESGENMFIIGGGCISRELAEYIVRIHNGKVDRNIFMRTKNLKQNGL